MDVLPLCADQRLTVRAPDERPADRDVAGARQADDAGFDRVHRHRRLRIPERDHLAHRPAHHAWLRGLPLLPGGGRDTRAELASFLVRALTLPASAADYYTDDAGRPAEADITALAQPGSLPFVGRDASAPRPR